MEMMEFEDATHLLSFCVGRLVDLIDGIEHGQPEVLGQDELLAAEPLSEHIEGEQIELHKPPGTNVGLLVLYYLLRKNQLWYSMSNVFEEFRNLWI